MRIHNHGCQSSIGIDGCLENHITLSMSNVYKFGVDSQKSASLMFDHGTMFNLNKHCPDLIIFKVNFSYLNLGLGLLGSSSSK